MTGSEDRKGLRGKECRQLLETRNDKEMDFPLEPAEGNAVPVRPILDFWIPEMWGKKFVLFQATTLVVMCD